MDKKVLLGMSGGVDSSASAILLQQMGYNVIGCTMNLLEEENKEAIIDAKKVCEKLGIEHHVIDCRKEFKCYVIQNFIDEYKNARTPNPCVVCNKNIKFGLFVQKAEELGCEYIATGHYAKTEYSEKYGQKVIRKSNEEKKDQTYFLYSIPKDVIEKIIFPLQNNESKDDTRNLAQEAGLEVAKKKDSQEICFIKDNDYKNFLLKQGSVSSKKGNIVLKSGEILGKHQGIINYTIGQRKGLGVSYKEPLYVIDIDKSKNEVIVGEEKVLYNSGLKANNINWLIDVKGNELEVFAKIRYRAKEAKAQVKIIDENNVEVYFEEPQRAITKGQSVVFYDDTGVLLGGGIIVDKM